LIAVSALTIAELVSGPCGAGYAFKRRQREHHLRYVVANVEPLSFDLHCARAYGLIYGAIIRTGRKPRGSRALDLMIAATALAHGLPLYTMNAKDLRGLEDLIEIIDVGAGAGRD
jgi:predicted nucleic acid-binding protein